MSSDPSFLKWAREHQGEALIKGALLEPRYPHDYVGAALVVKGVLYFRDAYRPEVRHALQSCFDGYAELAEDHLKWLWQDGKDGVPLRQGHLDASILAASTKDEPLGVYVTSGEKSIDAGFWEFHAFGFAQWQEKMGTWGPNALVFTMPLLHVAENPLAFQTLFVDFARRLNAIHGYGGYGVNLSVARREPNEATEYWLAQQFSGLDVGHPFMLAEDLAKRIKGVSWLTALDAQFVKEAGGLPTLRSELPPDWFALYPCGDGIVIQAGPQPEAGAADKEGGRPTMPASYVIENAALREIRATSVGPLQQGTSTGDAPLFNTAGHSDKWLARFDVPEADLLGYKAALLEMPPLQPDSTLPDRL
ncbi:type VI immunity family protein [Paraburkholderia sp. DD10]|uniref:type VI immunity family protein n=1 Tax=Paraburkholderia sp. DD10 TaxID=3409691 RepID=UPI003B9FF93F